MPTIRLRKSGAFRATQTLLLAGLASNTYADSTVEFCPPYSGVAQLQVDVKKPFLQYALTVVKGADGRAVVNIVADDLKIDAETLGSIVRSAAAADPSLGRLTVQARRIRFVDRISIINGTIQFLAQEISFEDGSLMSVLPDANSRVSFIAQSIHLSSSGFRHFDVHARVMPDGSRDTFNDISTLLLVRAGSLSNGGQPISEETSAKVLATRFSRFPITDFASKIDIKLGAAGRSAWITETKRNPDWPKYSVAVLRSAFKVAPFSRQVQQDVRDAINKNLIVLKEVAAAEDIFDAQTILNAATSGVDLNGNGPAYSTNRPLGALIKDLEGYEAGGRRLTTLDFYVKALTEASGNAPIPQNALDQQVGALNEEIRSAAIEYQNTNNNLTGLQTTIDATSSRLKALTSEYENRQQRLKEHAEDVKKGKEQRAQIVSGLATAAAIATTAYTGNPQTGAAVGGVVYAVGNATGGKPVIDSLSAGYQFAAAIEKPLKSVSSKASELKQSRDKYSKFIDTFSLANITILEEIDVVIPGAPPDQPQTKKVKRDDALKELADQAGKLKEGVDDILSVYDKFKPEVSPLPVELEDDETLQRLGLSITEALGATKNLTLELEALQRIMQEQNTRLITHSERKSKLATLPVQNEARRRMLGALALEGARDELAEFASLLDLIRRVSIVEFRAPLQVDPAQIQNAYVMERIGSGFDPTAVLDQQQVGQQYIDLLRNRMLHVTLLAGAVKRASIKQFTEYVELMGRAPYISYPTEEFVESAGAKPAEKRFMQQLNALLREQYEARKNPEKLAMLTERQLELPFNLSSKIDTRYPARLLQIGPTAIEHSGKMSGGDVVFRIEVERVGNLRKQKKYAPAKPSAAGNNTPVADLECFSVDLRPKNTPHDAYYIPSEFTIDQIKSGMFAKTPAQSFWYLPGGDSPPTTGRTMMITYPPAEARMYLKVRLDANTVWATAPTVKKLRVVAEIFQ